MIKLKSCPFCGGKAEIKPWYEINWFCVGCRNVECHGEIMPGGGFGYESKEIAAEAWNRRVTHEPKELSPEN
jgi:hypothetical protein